MPEDAEQIELSQRGSVQARRTGGGRVSCSLSVGSVEEPGLGGRATATRPDFTSTPATKLILDPGDPQLVSVSNMKNVGRRLQPPLFLTKDYRKRQLEFSPIVH